MRGNGARTAPCWRGCAGGGEERVADMAVALLVSVYSRIQVLLRRAIEETGMEMRRLE